MKRLAFAVTAILLTCSLAACSAGSEPPIVENNPPAESGPQDAARIEPENGGAAIILNMNGTDIHARLYDNTAADAFLKLLPYTVTVSRAADDLCGTVSEQLSHDPAEDQDTWAVGEIGWFDGWFTILCGNEEGMPKRTRTIIGKDHGFTDIADFQILDEDGSMTLTVQGGSVLTERKLPVQSSSAR